MVEVCSYYSITEEQFFARNRKRLQAKARQMAMYIMRHHGNINTFVGIRDFFAFRGSVNNHATVMHGVSIVETELRYNKAVKEDLNTICDNLCLNRRDYVDINWFMRVNKGDKLHLKYGIEGENTIIWEHESIETRGGRTYIKGRVRKGSGWEFRDDMMYEEEGFMCAGDGHRIFVLVKRS